MRSALLISCALASCASPRPREAPPILHAQLQPAKIVAKKPAKPEPNQDLALELDLKLSELLAQRRIASQEIVSVTGRRIWPEKVRGLWSRIAIYLDDMLDRAPGDYSVPLIMRTRVGLDTELDATIKQHGKPPTEILDALRRVNARLDKHLHSPDSPRLEENIAELRLRWPVTTPLVTSKFGKRVDPIVEGDVSRFHAGIDLGAETGEVVVAAGEGRISFVGWLEGRGNTVVVQHGSGFVTLYAHLREMLVELGARVAPGTPIGLVGSSGRATGPHLHFEVRRRGVPVDPETFLPSLAAASSKLETKSLPP